MGKYSPGGHEDYHVRWGLLPYEWIPQPYHMDKHVHKKLEDQHQFYSRLLASVKEEGFRNPILVWWKNDEITVPYGGSRAWVAIQLKIPVPAFVCDWTHDERFSEWERVYTVDECLPKFSEIPDLIEFAPGWFHFWGCEQTQLADKDREFFKARQDKNTRVWWTKGKGVNGPQRKLGPHLYIREVKVREGSQPE